MISAPHTLDRLRAGELAGITRLDLSAGLETFPPEIFSLADSLEVLNLSGNCLSTLPDDLPRLHRLRVVFCSENRFTELPRVLGRCAGLDIAGFKSNRIERVPGDALPASLRWLILTDNAIESLPDELGRCARLQKLMLSGNRLTSLPMGMSACQRLELVRIAANRFDRVPRALLELPALAWLAFAGETVVDASAATIDWRDLRLGAKLGEGASGVIHRAEWQAIGEPARTVAVKLFKGAVTSDGWPATELGLSLAAGDHPNIVGAEACIVNHPEGLQGLVMRIVPAGYSNLAAPPSLASCTRDVYPDALRMTRPRAARIVEGAASALAHLHARGLMHGDLYAHNLLVDEDGHCLLGDLGAASFLPEDAGEAEALREMDRRALAVLADELTARIE